MKQPSITFVVSGDLNTVLVEELNEVLQGSSPQLKAIPSDVPNAAKAFLVPSELLYAAAFAGVLNFLLNAWKAWKPNSKENSPADKEHPQLELQLPSKSGYVATSVRIQQAAATIEILDAPGRRVIRIVAHCENESCVQVHVTQELARVPHQ